MNTRVEEEYQPVWRRWRTWTEGDATLAGLTYERVRDELRHGPDHRKDELLAALVRLAQHHPELVAVVVDCLQPGLRALIARYGRGLESAEARGIAVEALWETITRYRPDIQTSYVAGRLLQLPKSRLRRAATMQDRWRDHRAAMVERPDRAGAAGVELSAPTLLRMAVDAGALDAADAWLIYATRFAGHTLRWTARQLDTTYEAAKKRRQRAEARWATWWTAPASAPPPPAPAAADRQAA